MYMMSLRSKTKTWITKLANPILNDLIIQEIDIIVMQERI